MVRWHRTPHKILRYIPLDVAKKHKFTYVDYLQVMNSSGEVKEVVKLLENDKLVFSRAEKYLLLSVALNNQKGSMSYAASNYQLGLAHTKPNDLQMIDYIFDKIPHTPRLTETLQKWSKVPESSKIARALLLKIYYKGNQVEELEELLDEMDTKEYPQCAKASGKSSTHEDPP